MKHPLHDMVFCELSKAAWHCKHSVEFLRMRIVLVPKIFEHRMQILQRFCNLVGSLVTHFLFLKVIWKIKGRQLIIVQDFLTVPLLSVWPFLYPWRKKLLFTVNHNIQKKESSFIQKHSFNLLMLLGCRLLLLEFQKQNIEMALGYNHQNHLTLPFLTQHLTTKINGGSRKRLTLGVIGFLRTEKNMDQIINELIQHRQKLSFNILVGVPCKKDQARINIPHIDQIRFVNTTEKEDYFHAIEQCDIVYFNYDSSEYYWRHSGVIAECLERRKHVVCPDFPLLASQVEWPVKVGSTYSEFESISDIIRRAINERELCAKNFEVYLSARSAAQGAKSIDHYIENFC